MYHYLTFQDDVSNKFWQIQTLGNSFTVTFGRIGTTGQSQTKAFDTIEKCEKEAEKLVAEKRKKGYEEDGYESTIIQKSNTIIKEDNTKDLLVEYDELIKKKHFEDLLPFLQKLSQRQREPMKKHIKKAKRYWLDYVELDSRGTTGHTWGYRGDEKQREIIVWSAIAIFSKDEIWSWDEPFKAFQHTFNAEEEKILLWAKPTWIGDYLLEKALKNAWMSPQYQVWRKLEAFEMLTPNPQLAAMSLGNHNVYHSESKKAQSFIDFIVSDTIAVQRDIPQLFEYETNIQNCYGNDETYKWRGTNLWEAIFRTLLDNGKLNRQWFLDSCLRVQTKEWNNGSKTFFKKCIDNIQPTADELIESQEFIFPLLHASYNQVVNYGVSLLKSCYEADGFNTSAFLEWSSPVLMRDDCKGSIKTLLSMFEKIVKHQPEFQAYIMELIADVFAVGDLTLQEKASKILQKYAQTDHDTLQEKLELYAPQFLGNVSESLKSIRGNGGSVQASSISESYQFSITSPTVLLAENEVQIPNNWNDILFHIGTFIQSGGALNDEILIAIFIQKRHLFPSDYQEQCKPYLKKLEKTHYESLFKNLTAEFLKSQINLPKYALTKPNYFNWYKNQTLKLHFDRLIHAEQKITEGSTLSLLSMPTHEPFWVAPQVLVERIIAYEKANEVINHLDLAIAIARMPREQVEQAIVSCTQIKNQDLKELLLFCLGASTQIKINKKQEWKLINVGRKWYSSKEDDYCFLWALAARTYYPNHMFEEFRDTALASIPYVVNPLPIIPQIKERWNEWNNYEGKLVRSSSWWSLELDLPQSRSTPAPLLYSHDVVSKSKDWYQSFYFKKDDVVIFSSLIPQNLEPIFVCILSTVCDTSENGTSAIEGGLQILLSEGMVFDDASLLFLSCACLQQKREYRGLAAEVLIFHFQHQSINSSKLAGQLGFLLKNKYAPIARLVEILGLVKDVSNLHNHALVLLLDGILLAFDSKTDLPVNFKKLLEIYLDVLVKTRQQPSTELRQHLEQWIESSTLKNIVKQLIQ
ncbi:MAG: DUF6493 family protein [Spirosomataceae bacterium]